MTIAPRRKALVTGGASGFGLEIARRLIAAEAGVAILDRDRSRLADAAEALGDKAIAIEADVSSRSAVRAAVDRAQEAMGGIDTVVLSAGVIHVKPVEEVTEEDWDTTIDVNLKGAFLVAQAAAPFLRASGRGRLVGISSIGGHRGYAQNAAYSASKFGLVGLIESLAAEFAPDGVTVNCVSPGAAPTTSMGQQLAAMSAARGQSAEEIKANAKRVNPLGRNATEGDVAAAVLFFIDDDAAFLTGVSLDVSGGARLGGALFPPRAAQPRTRELEV